MRRRIRKGINPHVLSTFCDVVEQGVPSRFGLTLVDIEVTRPDVAIQAADVALHECAFTVLISDERF